MACFRGICKRVNLLHTRRVYPFSGHRFGGDHYHTLASPNTLASPTSYLKKFFPDIGAHVFLEKQHHPFVRPVGFRYMSSKQDKDDGIHFEGIPDEIIELAPPINEVALATSDSGLFVAAVQHLINGVHSLTGLNWWLDISLTTAMMYGIVSIPIDLYVRKASHKAKAKEVNVPESMLFEIRRENETKFLKIRTMAIKMPSFQTGGALWFTDLSTADSTLILPLLAALTFWMRVDLHKEQGKTEAEIAVRAAMSIPFVQFFDNALMCHWITYNLIAIVYELAIKESAMQKLLGLPSSEEKEKKKK